MKALQATAVVSAVILASCVDNSVSDVTLRDGRAGKLAHCVSTNYARCEFIRKRACPGQYVVVEENVGDGLTGSDYFLFCEKSEM